MNQKQKENIHENPNFLPEKTDKKIKKIPFSWYIAIGSIFILMEIMRRVGITEKMLFIIYTIGLLITTTIFGYLLCIKKIKKQKKILTSVFRIVIIIFSFILFRFFGGKYPLAYILGLFGILIVFAYPIFERKGKL